MILRFFKKAPFENTPSQRAPKERPEERADVAPGDDPVRRILAVPRGAARLDAFEEALASLMPGTHGHRGVSLAFHRELTTLAERAGVDLALLKGRVERCAEALFEAGEVERAAHLLAKIGKKRRAAELFVAAGAIDELEEAHAAALDKEGGPHLSARLAYERFEALFAVGLRAEALSALFEAARLWPENAIYGEIAARFSARVPRHVVRLRTEGVLGAGLLHLHARWPLLVGRKDDAAFRVTSPLVSREHLEISLVDGRPVVRNLAQRRDTRVDGRVLDDVRSLLAEGTFDLGGVELRYVLSPHSLALFSSHSGGLRVVAPLSSGATISLRGGSGEGLTLCFDGEDRLFVQPSEALTVNGERFSRPLLLLEGDHLRGPGFEVGVLEGAGPP